MSLKATVKVKYNIYELSDLYQMGFASDMSLNEYVRESTQNTLLAISPDVQLEQEKIKCADMIAFIFPLWWCDCPSKLKGSMEHLEATGIAESMRKIMIYDLGKNLQS